MRTVEVSEDTYARLQDAAQAMGYEDMDRVIDELYWDWMVEQAEEECEED